MTTHARRAYGTGSIERYRGRFRARFPFAPGASPEVVGEYDTHEAAERALEAVLVAIVEGNGGVRGTPLRKVVEKMLRQRRAQGYASVGGEESDWKSYLAPLPLAARPVQDLTQGEVMSAILALKGRTKRNKGQPLALSTRRKLLNIVRAALYAAKADELVESNVLADARFADPKGQGARKKKAKRALTWDQFEALWKASKAAPEVAVAIWTGCRQGELRALHWRDVHNVGDVKCSCDEHRDEPHLVIRYGRPPTALDDPETCTTKSGEPRVVSLFGRALEALEALPRGDTKRNPKGIVFVSRVRGYRAKGRLVGRLAWSTWKTATGLAWLRWHDLRHTCGTWLVRGTLGAPWPLEAVKEHLGHSELKVTERYADQRGGSQARAMVAAMSDDAAQRSATSPAEAQQRAEKLSHLRDLNSRPTVYEAECLPSNLVALDGGAGRVLGVEALWVKWERFVVAVRDGSPFAISRGLDFAAAWSESQSASTAAPVRGVR
jgi:integrase